MKTDPEAAGLDAKRLARIGEHLRASYVEPGKIAGCQVAVVRHGEIAHFESLGQMDLEAGKPVAEDTIWRWFSMTKPVTGVALMTLYEKGKFQLNDPVHKFIPEWRDMQVRVGGGEDSPRTVPAQEAPTIKHVMMHMSGIGYGENNGDLDLMSRSGFLKDQTLETLCQHIGSWPLRFQPGTHWLYSFGMDVCARLVEVMSGMRFDDYLRTEIFEPLGMVDTGFFVPEAAADRLAVNYFRMPDKSLRPLNLALVTAGHESPKLLNGGGGLFGTTSDYVRFVTMLANGGELNGRRILSRKTIELMASNHLPGDADMSAFALPGGYGEVGFAGRGFGLTVAVSHDPARSSGSTTRGEFMWGGAASTTFFVDPAEKMGMVFMTQLVPSGTFNFNGQLKSIVYGALAD